MNFEKIFHGMIGKDFIKAFNDNFTIADTAFLEILATLLYKVKSTDIKEFKVEDGIVKYTLEEAPIEGEDDRTWTPVDITQWGNINGNLEDQEDLYNILEDKAAVETVNTISNLLSTLRKEFDNLKENYDETELTVSNNVKNISDLQQEIITKVKSINIKEIRLSNAIFQWSPDGKTWYQQPTIENVAWGRLYGDIENQEDLMQKFNEIRNNIRELQQSVYDLEEADKVINERLKNVEDNLKEQISNYEQYIETNDTNIANLKNKMNNVTETNNNMKAALDAHLGDNHNPHQVTANDIGLGDVDNTPDIDKPVSNPVKEYVAEAIKSIEAELAGDNYIKSDTNRLEGIYLITKDEYEEMGGQAAETNDLYFIIDDSELFNTPIDEETETKGDEE